jgi:hypothetical protein
MITRYFNGEYFTDIQWDQFVADERNYRHLERLAILSQGGNVTPEIERASKAEADKWSPQ